MGSQRSPHFENHRARVTVTLSQYITICKTQQLRKSQLAEVRALEIINIPHFIEETRACREQVTSTVITCQTDSQLVSLTLNFLLHRAASDNALPEGL